MFFAKNEEEKMIKRSKYWDKKWYKSTYLCGSNFDPLDHFIKYGWKRGYKPSPGFDLLGYQKFYADVKASGINPLYHYEKYGKGEGKFTNNFEENTILASEFFDEAWYSKTYNIHQNPVAHYLDTGWKLGYNPSKDFSTLSYLAFNYDVRKQDINPLLHYERYGRKEQSNRIFKEPIEAGVTPEDLKHWKKKQDKRLPLQYDANIRNLILFLVPERDGIGGGLMSIASLARVSRKQKSIHHSEVMIATVPSCNTICNYSSFDAGFDIFRFEQIPEYFQKLENVIIHIPENFVGGFIIKLSVDEMLFLQRIKNLQINILNQNNLLMLRPYDIEYFLRKVCTNLTMTVAHKQYCTMQMRTAYGMPVHLFSASNLVSYYYTPYDKKDNLLVYSPDDNPYKSQIIEKIKKEFPKLKLLQIDHMSYEQYRRVISRAKWMITFGEGLDGYFAESIRSGAISFAVYNNVFFDDSYENLPNIYSSFPDMLDCIANDIRNLDSQSKFANLSDRLISIDKKEYDDEQYIKNIKLFYEKKYTYSYRNKGEMKNIRSPKISIVMATYNGEKFLLKQLLSLKHMDYDNYEIIISDDGSTDRTINIIEQFKQYMPITLVHNNGAHGLNSNFANAIKYASGQYIALCDQDDIWLPSKFKVLLDKIDDFDIVYGNVTVIDQNDQVHPWQIMHDAYEYDKSRYYHFNDFVYENIMLGCCSLIRRELLEECLPIPDGVLYHDWWIVLNAIKCGKGICYVDIPVIKYRQHDKNTAKSTFDKPDWYIKRARFDELVLDYFNGKLTDYEKKILENDRCWNLMRNSLRYRSPHYLNEFFDSNRMSFDNQLILKLNEEINEEK